MTTYETSGAMTEQVYQNHHNNNIAYDDEVENSETSTSSNSSFVEDIKKRDGLINNENGKEEKSKRSKRNSFTRMFKKDDKEKKDDKGDKEKPQSDGLVRSLSGMFGKDNKRNNSNNESENFLRPNSRTSSTNSDNKSKNRRSFIFFSDNEDDADLKKGRKSRQNSHSDVEKDKLVKKGNRLSMNLNKILGLDENKSHKPNNWTDNFLEPNETVMIPRSPTRNTFQNGPPTSLKKSQIINNSSIVESPRDINPILSMGTGINHVDKPNSKSDDDKSPNDDVQSFNSSSTRPSSVDDQEEIHKNDPISEDNEQYSPITPMTPKLIVTHSDLDSIQEKVQEEQLENVDGTKQVEVIADSKPEVDRTNHRIHEISNTMNVKPLIINEIHNPIPAKSDDKEQEIKDTDDKTTNIIEEQVLKKLQELEEINSSLNEVKTNLEAKVVEQNGQINKLNSMEQIMQQQIDLNNRMTETIQRLESKINQQKEEFDNANVGKIFEDSMGRLEKKIDQQNDEINYLKSIVEQLTGGNRLLLTNGEDSQVITQIINRNEDQKLIPINPSRSPQICSSSHTLVNTLVVDPIYNTVTVSASIAVSVIHAVYIRPVVSLVKVFTNGM